MTERPGVEQIARIRARHHELLAPANLGPDARYSTPRCEFDHQAWPCDAAVLLAGLRMADSPEPTEGVMRGWGIEHERYDSRLHGDGNHRDFNDPWLRAATPAPPEPGLDERARAITLATWVLDRPNADPDDDLAVVSRQFLRCIDRAAPPPSLPPANPSLMGTVQKGGDIAEARRALVERDPKSPQWEDCKVCGGDHWTKDHPATGKIVVLPDEPPLRSALEWARLALIQDVEPDAIIVHIEQALAATPAPPEPDLDVARLARARYDDLIRDGATGPDPALEAAWADLRAAILADISRQVAALSMFEPAWMNPTGRSTRRGPDAIKAAVLAILQAADPLEGRTDE